ncbi:hypothetical protein DAPPUDRAFT_253421 [Daphnia pulex]|uniref:Ankyrin repeat domain-containing protein 54 n=1 Tax=Daphnia pulex TaxID=6669 RepID=E9H4T0_DAPPU|nr:hypothetical protein DAPPUDRAFT_253421 [Daphnia pulex]|eukprot:EFX73304.1 hypothetical protein DAPPUDRAFT_253421 [Daphnia pulex]
MESRANVEMLSRKIITYAECEAFFQAVTRGSREDLIRTLNTHGPAVTTELSKSYNEQGQTPLLVAILQGHLDVVKFLVGKLDVPIGQIGQMILNGVKYLDVPALYVAIVCGELDIAAYLLSIEVRADQQTAKMIDSIVSSPNGRQQKINILELMGAVNFYFYETHPAPQNGLMYWRAARHLRQSTVHGEPGVVPINEFTTLEQLEQLSRLELFTQAILVSQRVLDMVHPGPHIFNLAFWCNWASICSFRQGQSGRAIQMLIYVLKQSQALEQWKGFKTSQIINWALDIIETSLVNLQERSGQEEFPFPNFMTTFNFASQYMSYLQENRQQRKIDQSTLLGLASLIVQFIFWASELMPQWSDQERKLFKHSLSLFIAKHHRWGKANQNLLHTVCHLKSIEHTFAGINELFDSESDSGSERGYDETDETTYRPYSSDLEDVNLEFIRDYREIGDEEAEPEEEWTLSITKCLLELGADPNAADLYGATPLHLLAMNRGNLAQSSLLLEYGARIHQMNANRLTPLILFQEWQSQIARQGNPDHNLQSVINSAPPRPLRFLASQVLRKSGIPFDEEKVPPVLQSFIQRH